MELKLSTDLSVIPQNIIFNFDELKENLDTNLEKYRNMVVTEDGIRAAKTDRAKLNKLKTALDDKRKDVKFQCLVPYNAFENQIKQLTAMISDAMLVIDNQTKAFEQKEKDEKLDALKKFYQNNARSIQNIVPFDKIYNTKWLNKTISLMDATQEIISLIGRIESDLDTIDSIETNYKLQIKDKYLQTLDLSAALAENKRLNEVESKLAKAVKPKPKDEFLPKHTETETAANEPLIPPKPTSEENIQAITITIYATPEQKKKLGIYMRENGIKYEAYKGGNT